MKSPALQQFLQAVAADAALQAQIGSSENLAQLVQRAQTAGFAVTARELQLWAHDKAFAAPWWPWAGGGRAQRTVFFGHRYVVSDRGPLLLAPSRCAD